MCVAGGMGEAMLIERLAWGVAGLARAAAGPHRPGRRAARCPGQPIVICTR
jgi:hypothetical protein